MTEPTKFLLITPNMADDKMFMRNLFDIPYLVLNNTLTVDQVISIVPQADNLDLVIAFRSYNSFPLFAEDSNTYFSQKFVDMLNALKTKSATFSVTFMTPDKVPSDALAALTMPTKVVSTQIKQELTVDQALYFKNNLGPKNVTVATTDTPDVAPATTGPTPKTSFISGDAAPLIRAGEEVIKGIKYSNSKKTFYLTDDITWQFNLSTDTWLELEEGEIFDGRHHQISSQFDGTDANYGLFKIGTVTDPNKKPLIKHLTVRSRVGIYGGGIVRQHQSNFHVHECEFKGAVRELAGGICGDACHDFVIDECKAYGIIGENAGGICGYVCYNGEITKCYVDGSIKDYGGGICGNSCYNLMISKCIVDGDICSNAGGICAASCYNLNISKCRVNAYIGEASGGITGRACYTSDGSFIVDQCYTTNTIGSYGGGIIGYNNVHITVSNCYSTGHISAHAGGISATESVNLYIKNCYSSGEIGFYGGGIVAFNSYSYPNYDMPFTVEQCYSLGKINAGAGGIVASNCQCNVPMVVLNCYSVGRICSSAGGIIGEGSNLINVTNTYASGSIAYAAAGIAYNSSNITMTNCYNKSPSGPELDISLIHHDKLDVLPTDVWKADDSYPMLRDFRRKPWEHYNDYDDKAKL